MQLAEPQNKLLRVLIVEDEPRLRDVIPEMGFSASAARSAEDALRIMQSDPHEILLLDLHLPLMSGMEMLERVRRDWPATQAIILTAYGDLAAAQRAIRLDVVEFLSKPFHLRDVELALDRARRRCASARERSAREGNAETEEPKTLAEGEYEQIIAALRRNNGNRTAAAADLGIGRRTLHYRLADYRAQGLDVE